MTARELVDQVRAALQARADEEFRRGVANFFREPVNPYGVRSPDVQAIARDAAREMKPWSAAERDRFASALWRSGRLEEATVATWAYRRFARQCGAREFAVFENWLDRHVHNWANCDGLATWLLAGAIANEPALIARLQTWTAAPNRWKRRAAIVALLQEAKRGRNTAEIFETAQALLQDADDMVQKGVGWVLKEAYPARPAEVMEFLLPRAAAAPRLVLRLAAEKMGARDRAALTRAAAPLPHGRGSAATKRKSSNRRSVTEPRP
ncbi:MAG TPA: DNA alkylation repair protein [Bryobacteraceae bacterium]|nr:DNA alkylation repair protein [Bryobacteraceae bacterium]